MSDEPISRDAIYGNGASMVHLLFHFKKPDGDAEGRLAGHFDLLLPAKDTYKPVLTLPQLVSCKNNYIYTSGIYIYSFSIYIHIYLYIDSFFINNP